MQGYGGPVIPILIACMVAACASKSPRELAHDDAPADGSVCAEPIAAPTDARYQAMPGVDFAHGTANEGNALPVYPVELLASRLPPVQVVVRLVVDADGVVDQASVIDNPGGHQAFADATLSAVRGWTFLPLRRIEDGQATRVPFTQDYRVTYRQRDGRGSVDPVTP